MDNFDFSPYKGLYLKTAREYIVKIQQSTDALIKKPDNHDAIMTLYISAHSLGSQSTLTNYKNMEAVCGVIEHIFLKVKEGNAKGGTERRLPKVSEELLLALKDSIIGLTNCVDSIDKEDKEIDLSDIIKKFKAITVQ